MASTTNKNSIAGLRVYQLALTLEDRVYKLAKALPQAELFELGNDLRRGSAGVAHHIFDSHRRYSYALKMDSLHSARTEAETLIKNLQRFEQAGYGKVKDLTEEYTALIKQSWGLIKWLKKRQSEHEAAASTKAKDELVASRN